MDNLWRQTTQVRYLESSKYRGILELRQENERWKMKAVRRSSEVSLYAFSEFAYCLLNGKCEFLKNEEIDEIELSVYSRSGTMLAQKSFVKGDTFDKILQTLAEEMGIEKSEEGFQEYLVAASKNISVNEYYDETY